MIRIKHLLPNTQKTILNRLNLLLAILAVPLGLEAQDFKLGIDGTLCKGQQASFHIINNSGGPIDQINWKLTDPEGNVVHNETNDGIDHTFATPGLHNFDINFNSSGGAVSLQEEVYVMTHCPGDFDVNISGDTCVNTSLNVSATTFNTSLEISRMDWQIIGAEEHTINNMENFSQTLGQPGIYEFNVTVTHNQGTGNASGVIFIDNPTQIGVTKTDATCQSANGSISIDISQGTSPHSVLWSDGNQAINRSNLSDGNYQVTVTDSRACKAQTTVTINNTTPPDIILGSDILVCQGDSTPLQTTVNGDAPFTFTWTPNTGINDITAQTPLVSPFSTTTYTVVVTDANGCTSSKSSRVTPIDLPGVNIDASFAVVCLGESVQLNASADGSEPISYSWSPSESYDDPNASNPTLTPTTDGMYAVEVMDGNGCSASDSVIVDVIVLPTVSIGEDTSICHGEGFVISPDTTAEGSISSFAWHPAAGLSSSVVASPTLSPNNTTMFTVTVQDDAGCLAKDSIVVTVHDLPTVDLGPDTAICEDVPLQTQPVFTGDLITQYGWTPDKYVSNPSGKDPLINPPSDTSYVLRVRTIHGCIGSDTIGIIVIPKTDITLTATPSTCGLDNGAVRAVVDGFYPPFTFLWSDNGTDTAITGKGAGIYRLTVTDNMRCENTSGALITDNEGPTVTADLFQDANCGGSDGGATSSVTGGTAPFTYEWSDGSTGENLVLVPAGTYEVAVTDQNGCIGGDTVVIANIGDQAPTISGTVVLSQGALQVNSGTVILIRLNEILRRPEYIDTVSIDTNQSFRFDEVLPIGKYVLWFIPDTQQFPNAIPSYYTKDTNSYKWQSATKIDVVCDSNYQFNGELIDLTPANGLVNLRGNVVEEVEGKWLASTPVKGIDIIVEKNPSGAAAITKTDEDGNYTFNGLPKGEYTIHVNIPGLPQEDTYEVEIETDDDTTVVDLDFTIGDTVIFKTEEEISTFLNDWVAGAHQVSLYPNPVQDQSTIRFDIGQAENVSLRITDLLGKEVYFVPTKQVTPGQHAWEISTKHLPNKGTYMATLSVGQYRYQLPLVVLD